MTESPPRSVSRRLANFAWRTLRVFLIAYRRAEEFEHALARLRARQIAGIAFSFSDRQSIRHATALPSATPAPGHPFFIPAPNAPWINMLRAPFEPPIESLRKHFLGAPQGLCAKIWNPKQTHGLGQLQSATRQCGANGEAA